MSRFRKVAAGTWADERFRALSEPAKHLWFYLLTGPEVTSLPGLLIIGRAGLAEALGWSVTKLDRCFAELEQAVNADGVPMAKADWKARLVWLPKGHKHNSPANPNVILSWKDLWRSVPECSLKHEALIVLREFIQTLPESFQREFQRSIDRYDSVRSSRSVEVPESTRPSLETVSSSLSASLSPTLPEESTEDLTRARARARTASAPASSLSREDLPTRLEGPIDSGGGSLAGGSPPVVVGSASGQEACEVFVDALAECGRRRAPVRAKWDREALCDAINTHLNVDGTAFSAIAAMRTAVAEWVEDLGDERAKFSAGWSPTKFADWLATREPEAEDVPPTRPPEPEQSPSFTPDATELARRDSLIRELEGLSADGFGGKFIR